MTDLKPCICGSDKVHFGYEPFCGLTFWRVMCDTCGTQTSTFDTKEEAAKVWNTRPAEDAKDKEIERLKAALLNIKNRLFERTYLNFGEAAVADWIVQKVNETLSQALTEAIDIHENAYAPDTDTENTEENKQQCE